MCLTGANPDWLTSSNAPVSDRSLMRHWIEECPSNNSCPGISAGMRGFIQIGDKRPAHFAKQVVGDYQRGNQVGDRIADKFPEIGVVDAQTEQQVGSGCEQEHHACITEKPEKRVARVTHALPEFQSL